MRLKFTNRGALFVTNFYIIYGQTLKLFFQECEGSDIIFDNNFLFSKLFSFMIFCMEMYMELQLYLPFLFTSDVSMVFLMFSRVDLMMKMQCPQMLNMNIIVMIFSSPQR